MKKAILLATIWFLNICWLFAQTAKIEAGPMLGHLDFREANVWYQVSGEGTAHVVYWENSQPTQKLKTASYDISKATEGVLKFALDLVEPGKSYTYSLIINNQSISKSEGQFKTPAVWKWRTDPPDFKVAMGSCHYVNESAYDRPGVPYGDTAFHIFESIVKKQPDLFFWLGDNTYLREPDWNSRSGIMKRFSHTRKQQAIQPLLKACPNYAIWDDHDYGPNDSDRGFSGKHWSKEAFDLFWANPQSGVSQPGEGINFSFQYSDVDFFMLDDRYFKSPNDLKDTTQRTILGTSQLQWLLDNLLASKATFKVVGVGVQFLNTAAQKENFANCTLERQLIIDFIYKHNIKNVIFLTGDRHHAEFSILKVPGKPTIYDFTVSPLSSGLHTKAHDEENKNRVEGTLVNEVRNFGMVSFSGKRNERKVNFSLYDSKGGLIYQKNFNQE